MGIVLGGTFDLSMNINVFDPAEVLVPAPFANCPILLVNNVLHNFYIFPLIQWRYLSYAPVSISRTELMTGAAIYSLIAMLFVAVLYCEEVWC